MGLKYSPPTLSTGYRNGQRRLDRRQSHASGYPYMSPEEQSIAVKAIVDCLVYEYDELQQVTSKTMQRMIEEFYSNTQNNSVAGTSVGNETREDLSTVHPSDGDTSGDDTFGTSSSSHFVLEGEVEELPEAIRLAKQSERVNTKKGVTNKGTLMKKDRPLPASKLVIEYPIPFKRDRTTVVAATKNISKQATERRGTKPANSALRRKQNPKNDTSVAKSLASTKLLLLEVANSKAKQIDLKNKGRAIKVRLAREKKAEQEARWEALIAIKKDKQDRGRAVKAAAMEMKLPSIQRHHAEEKSSRVAAEKLMKAQMMKMKKMDEVTAMKEQVRLALALVKEQKARNSREKEHQLTMAPYQKKTNRYGMTGYKKNKFADFSVLEYEHDENDEITGDKPTDMSMMKYEIFGLREKLSRLQGEKEEGEEIDIMDCIENILLCGGTLCALNDNSLSSVGENSSVSELSSRV